MTSSDPDILSEEEAARVWRRAAQLQAEAAGDVEPPTVDEDHDMLHSAGYALTQVRSAALEAGIDDRFVEAALVDIRAGRLLAKEQRGHSLARRFLNHPSNTIAIRRVVEATPQEVLSAMEAVFPSEPFRLTLADQHGDPLAGGLLVFDLPGMRSPFEHGLAYETTRAGLNQVFVSLRQVEGPTASCEVTVHSAITSQNRRFGFGLVAATATGAAGLGALGALGLTVGIGPVGAIGGLLLGAGLGVKGARASYHFSKRRAQGVLERLAGAVAARAEGGWRG